MYYNFLATLTCPLCKGSLELIYWQHQEADIAQISIDPAEKEIIFGSLKCKCGSTYPIVEGVPRFLNGDNKYATSLAGCPTEQIEEISSLQVETIMAEGKDDYENIRKSFSQEWDLFDYNLDKTWGWSLEERKHVFLEDVRLVPEQLKGMRVLDAGCGNGTLTAALSDFGIEIVGFDLNDGLGLAYRNRTKYALKAKDKVQYVQGNIIHPPLREKFFDLVYCSGVIHHTPNSKEAFDSLVRLTKSGGRLYVWVYARRALPIRIFFSCGRYLKRWLSLSSLLKVCRLIAPFYKTATMVLNNLRIIPFRSRTTREITLDLFDAFAPRYNHCHTEAEVHSWFKAHQFKGINVSGHQKHGFGMYGDRP